MEKTISPLELSSLLNKSKQSCHNLSLAEYRVLTYLLACANIKDGEGYKCWPSTDTISEHTGIHTKTVEKVRKSLVDNGWMQYIPGKGKGNCNTYYVNGFKIVECSNKSGVPSPKGIIAPTKLPSATTKKVAKNQDNLVQNQKAKPEPKPVVAQHHEIEYDPWGNPEPVYVPPKSKQAPAPCVYEDDSECPF